MTSKQQCKSLEQVTPLTDDECLLRLHFSPEHILEGRVVPAAISTTDLGEKGFSLDRELLVDLDIVEARARTQSTRMPEKRESSYLSCFNCGNVRIIKSDGQDAIKNPAASGRGIEADLLPNPRFGLQALELRRRAAGNMSPTRFNSLIA